MPEEVFWREMNPRRLHTLFNAWFPPRRSAAVFAAAEAAGARTGQGSGTQARSLSEYLKGG